MKLKLYAIIACLLIHNNSFGMSKWIIQRTLMSIIDREIIQVGTLYEHYKSTQEKPMHYKVIAIAHDCENPQSRQVIYKSLYDAPGFPKGTHWSREYEKFAGTISIDGIEKDRFKKIDPKKS